jgi:hypothetical protein
MQSINRLNVCTSIYTRSLRTANGLTDSQAEEFSERCQARRDGAFQIVGSEITIEGGEQKVEVW